MAMPIKNVLPYCGAFLLMYTHGVLKLPPWLVPIHISKDKICAGWKFVASGHHQTCKPFIITDSKLVKNLNTFSQYVVLAIIIELFGL